MMEMVDVHLRIIPKGSHFINKKSTFREAFKLEKFVIIILGVDQSIEK